MYESIEAGQLETKNGSKSLHQSSEEDWLPPQKKCICTSRQSALSCLHISYCTLLHPIKYNISAQHLFDCVSFICQPQKIKNKSDHFEWPSIWEQAKELKERRRRVAFMMPCICICICIYICICICILEKTEDSLVTFIMLDPQIQWLSVPNR